MLPSTGYFKTINCPFYESGTCDRPYCHFKHSKREDAGVTAEATETVENRSTGQVEESKTTTMVTSDSVVLQQLVTEAVQKVLANRTVTDVDKFSCQNVVSQVVEGLKPTLTSGSSGTLDNITTNAIEKRTDAPTPVNNPLPCVYNPTPIAELKKRHIPIVSYMPTRESRVAVKRKCSPDGIKPWLNVGNESTESQNTEIKYKPTMIINSETRDTMQSYIPTCKSDSALSNSCKDSATNEYLIKLREAYYPKYKKRREEYVPKKVKTPLKTTDGLNESTLDHFKPDFNMMDEVLVGATTSDIQSTEVSQDSCIDFEPKFSDDEADNSNNEDNNEDTHIDCVTLKQNKSYCDIEKSECLNDVQDGSAHFPNAGGHSECVKKETTSIKVLEHEKFISEENSKSLQFEKKKVSEDLDKSTKKNVKEHKSSDKSKSKNQKDHSTSDKKYKDRHDSNERSRSTSHSKNKSKDKSKSHLKRESKELKDKKHDKERNKYKDQEKYRDKKRGKERYESKHKTKSDRRDHHGSGKHRQHTKSKSDRSDKYSKTDRKLDEKTIERLHVHTESKQDKISINKSPSSLKNVHLNLVDDDDEENDDHYSSVIDNDIDVIFSTSDSDHDVQEECLKIFQEYQVPKQSKTMESSKESSTLGEKEKEENEEMGRKRVAHPSAATCVTRQIGVKQAKKYVNPQQKMYERWRLMRDTVAEKTISASSSISKDVRQNCADVIGAANNSDLKLNGNGRVRIAHVPYAKSLTIEKKKVTESVAKSVELKGTDNYKTAAQTTKSGIRIAHVPQVVPQLIRPEPLQVTTQKFPLNVRQYYVNLMHDVCVLIYTNAEDAAQRAVKEEYSCHEKCKALAVYKNSCMLAVHRLKKEVDQNSSIENNTATVASSSMMLSHEAVLAGKAKGSWSVLKTKKSVTEFRGTALYGMLKKWILTEQQLRDNGFPRPHPDGQKGHAKVYVINSRNQNVLSKVPNERVCSRCGQTYMIDRQGFALLPQNCIYHWGRKFTIRGEGKYSCCQQYGSASGCCDAKTHVWEYIDYENLRGYVKTLPKDAPIEEQGVYALDCEMCYTTQGLELTRITVINDDCNVVYETLIKPQNSIIDYNTRFSGITEENMKDVTTTLLDVQATLLTMFSEKTILVGHSLESDFKALKLLHDTVVDTSVMFPHKNGYPQKRALKNLCSEYLRKIIQNDVGGHDSKEDAVACMELILWKAKEEAKLQ